jgi:hypothetical protein
MNNKKLSKQRRRGLRIPTRYVLGDVSRKFNKFRVSGIYGIFEAELDQDTYAPVTVALNKTMAGIHAV